MIPVLQAARESNASAMEQQHRRDSTNAFKRNITVIFTLISCLVVTTSLQASLYLHRSLEAPTNNPVSSSITASKQTMTPTSQSQRALRRESKMAERSRAIDSSTVPQQKRQLDFIIAGFPKTGTTSLLRAFGDHPETDIAKGERCAVINPTASDYVGFGYLQEAMSELSVSSQVRRGLKCPNAVYHAYSSIVRFERHAPNTKFVIGVRHPVEMLQSYYNYRITELYDQQKKTGGKKTAIPPLEDLVGMDKEWKGVSTDSTRFDLFLMQFGKTSVNTRDLREMIASDGANAVQRKAHHLAVKPNKFTIFLYTLDQMEDKDDDQRSSNFRSGLQHFLGLDQPLNPVGRENLNHFVGEKAYPETVDICMPKYKELRELLVNQGARSAQWIAEEFIQSPDVVVANRDHFLESIKSWGEDPCDYRATQYKILAAPDNADTKKQEDHRHEKKRFFVGRGRKHEVIPVKL